MRRRTWEATQARQRVARDAFVGWLFDSLRASPEGPDAMNVRELDLAQSMFRMWMGAVDHTEPKDWITSLVDLMEKASGRHDD